MLIRERQTYLWNLTKLEQRVSEESSDAVFLRTDWSVDGDFVHVDILPAAEQGKPAAQVNMQMCPGKTVAVKSQGLAS